MHRLRKLFFVLAAAALWLAPSAVRAEGVLGFQGGLNLADISGDDIGDTKLLPGFSFGGFYTHNLSEYWALQPEVLYTQKGTKEDAASDEDKLKLNYIEIPVLLKLKTTNSGSVRPNVFVGPAISFLGSAKLEDGETGEEFDIKDDAKSVDFGIVFGGGFDFIMGSGRVVTNARFNVGLTNVDDTGDSDLKNQAISFQVGYGFNI